MAENSDEDRPAVEAAPLRVSVVVPVHNGAGDLDLCLTAINRSVAPAFECIVVDDASTDPNVLDVIKRHPVRYQQQARTTGPAVARNTGAEIARGQILFFTDADVLLHPDAISKAVGVFDADSTVAAVIGSYDDSPGHRGLLSQYRNLYHHWNHQLANEEVSTFWTGCGAIRRDVFEELGGFSSDYDQPSIEDIELGYRLRAAGHRIRLNKAMLGKHLKRWRFVDMVRTDVFFRGVPWVALIASQPESMSQDLNLNMGARAATLAAACWLVAVLAMLVLGSISALLPTLAVFVSAVVGGLLADFDSHDRKADSSTQMWKSATAGVFGALLPLSVLVRTPEPWALLPLSLILIIVWMQRGFYRLMMRRGGLGAAFAVVPLQLVFFLGCAIAVPLGYLRGFVQRINIDA